MSDSIVIKRQCDRCPAVEETAITVDDIKAGKLPVEKADAAPKYEIKVAGKVVASFKRLCTACEEQVAKAVEDIGKKREKKTSKRS